MKKRKIFIKVNLIETLFQVTKRRLLPFEEKMGMKNTIVETKRRAKAVPTKPWLEKEVTTVLMKPLPSSQKAIKNHLTPTKLIVETKLKIAIIPFITYLLKTTSIQLLI